MPQFTYTGSEVKVYPTLSAADGSTLVVKPGDVVTLDTDPNVPDLTTQAAISARSRSDRPRSPYNAGNPSSVGIRPRNQQEPICHS